MVHAPGIHQEGTGRRLGNGTFGRNRNPWTVEKYKTESQTKRATMWSSSQQLALAVMPKVSSVFSLFGSFWIAIEVLTDVDIPKRRHPYHRLLLAMSIYDILESFWNFLSTWPIPKGTEGVWNPAGNTRTCTAQGFFLTLSVAVPMYNALLSIYYMLVINYRVSDNVLRKRVEPAFHLIVFIWAFGSAVVSAGMGLFNNANLWCWIAPFPAGCKDSRRYGSEADCERGDNAWIYRWVFYFAPLWFCIVVAMVCTSMVYSQVYRHDQRSLKYRRPESSSFMGVRFQDSSARFDRYSLSSMGSLPKFSRPSLAAAWKVRHDVDCISERSIEDCSRPGGKVEALDHSEMTEDNEERPPFSLLRAFRIWRENRKTFAQDNPRTTEVRQQALWYLVTFILTHIWSTTNRIIQQSRNGKTYFGLLLVHSFFDPLQGFLNFLVYQRPRYVRIRKESANFTVIEAIRRALRFSYLPNPPPQDKTSSRVSGFVSGRQQEPKSTHSTSEMPSSAKVEDADQSEVFDNPFCNVIVEETEKDISSRSLVTASLSKKRSSSCDADAGLCPQKEANEFDDAMKHETQKKETNELDDAMKHETQNDSTCSQLDHSPGQSNQGSFEGKIGATCHVMEAPDMVKIEEVVHLDKNDNKDCDECEKQSMIQEYDDAKEEKSDSVRVLDEQFEHANGDFKT